MNDYVKLSRDNGDKTIATVEDLQRASGCFPIAVTEFRERLDAGETLATASYLYRKED